MKKDTYLEVAISGRDIKSASLEDEVRDFLVDHGFNPGEIAQGRLRDRFETCVYLTSLPKARLLQKKFRRAWPRTSMKWSERLLEPQDWRDKWMLDYHSQPLGKIFQVIPLWEKEKGVRAKKNRKPLFLDPKSAFGSGTHDTTRSVLSLMESFEGKIQSFFDAGLGTGILSVAAHRLGATKIGGLDFDKPSVVTSKENLKLNGFPNPNFVCADFNEYNVKGTFDLICANLWTPVLIKNKKKFLQALKPGAHLIASGILKMDETIFRNAFKMRELRCKKVVRTRRWCAVLYKRID